MKDRIIFRDGKVYIVSDVILDTPTIRHLLFPIRVDLRAALAYGIRDGEPVEADGRASGLYHLPRHRRVNGDYLTVSLVHGGETTAEHVVDVSVLCPKVRAGVETRWNRYTGTWEKCLKTRGWVPA